MSLGDYSSELRYHPGMCVVKLEIFQSQISLMLYSHVRRKSVGGGIESGSH